MDHPPKRTLRLVSPFARGEDVRRLQVALNLPDDGAYGPVTAHAAKVRALELGAATAHVEAGVTQRAQTIIRSPSSRSFVEKYRAKQRAKAAAQVGKGASGAIKFALELAHRQPHITESPAGSNRGALIDVMQREVQMLAQPWCGAFVHYALLHGGNLTVTPEVRYCPATEAHAKNGTGGFSHWVPVSHAHEAPAGSLVLYGAGLAEHVELLCQKVTGETVQTVGGNTSSGDNGSQANGGGVFERNRPLSGGFPVRGFAVPRGL